MIELEYHDSEVTDDMSKFIFVNPMANKNSYCTQNNCRIHVQVHTLRSKSWIHDFEFINIKSYIALTETLVSVMS